MTDLNNHQNTTLESSNRLFESFEKDFKKSQTRLGKESLNTEYMELQSSALNYNKKKKVTGSF